MVRRSFPPQHFMDSKPMLHCCAGQHSSLSAPRHLHQRPPCFDQSTSKGARHPQPWQRAVLRFAGSRGSNMWSSLRLQKRQQPSLAICTVLIPSQGSLSIAAKTSNIQAAHCCTCQSPLSASMKFPHLPVVSSARGLCPQLPSVTSLDQSIASIWRMCGPLYVICWESMTGCFRLDLSTAYQAHSSCQAFALALPKPSRHLLRI